jgi:Leucine-rich repeat (LRR) protein
MKVHVVAGALLLLLAIAALAAPVAASEIVTFNDANLEDVVREALAKPEGDITSDDMATLSELGGLDREISDLSGLEYAVNLQLLNLGFNQISDISPLDGMTNLQSLYLSHNQISDISPLDGMTNLQSLDISANQISDISPLDGMTNLQSLDISTNQISDISPLDGMTNLQRLFFFNNQISDIGPLDGMTNLQDLWLGHNQISDIGPLDGMTNLRSLDISNNQISDISPLVANSGLGAGDVVALLYNYLDLTPGSVDMINIQALESNGVTVYYEPQLEVPSYTLYLLVATVESYDLPEDIEDGLTDKLDAAINTLNKGNERAALNILNAFILQVEAQRGKTLTNEQADYLIAEAQEIIGSISSRLPAG